MKTLDSMSTLGKAMTVVASLTATAADAHQLQCDRDGDRLRTHLTERWGETHQTDPRFINSQVYRITTFNPETGNWTDLNIGADGSACIVGSGVGYMGIDIDRALVAPLPSRQPL